ncbi:putative NADH dehydrogenase [ubiquinone] iron-sulfur protein 6, mitochondrial [Caenorhabditis elegans]|uniref:Probable NADH dehydrogenase [ubiquinone] iron-sulfur protein 6, mitochondrial n=1 Tax=Caenorhabditis elegans TaxID=6239 RepID=NDUS6_CAEEL|nr:putative NADH dehydrogenase [ubiquinone] iron-sulfur protein 6, mitochondrial [Caenorhabditis elegans]Q19724.1 RecName: Full=Probable NADH dehydrogenase [ubiquinone] iron-sulfur protein 6, mitochondrial; AltName: Full=Complex I-13kD-A; Short=CI-13kD-A; AltName: Full=NADH-ubiquinone oxidoreductase 13 kDa-A subunit; Flags: Precursor [Caenorhabditis elegans]CAA95810.1 Probable NADH dehydrogenase [ubiquinone] iron-sulfur protein 6, mitochondrial [Caenorhabditis elegans]|eukprot:NP_492007.1 Probable NADH dehydrogenase [ubiquinone] iron-sulfur protein 6, mitochondrial [Caenorhabditis elegans]
MNRLLQQSVSRGPLAVRASSTITTKPPTPNQITKNNAQFDKVTHTGQAWDQSDYRLQRFDISKKSVNPNVAMHLIDQRPPEDCGDKRVVFCDGGHPALGHPKVYINLDKPGVHACGYCGNRFYNSHATKAEDMKIQHLNC